MNAVDPLFYKSVCRPLPNPGIKGGLNVAYLRGAYFAVLIYSSDVGDGYGRVDFVKEAKINPV